MAEISLAKLRRFVREQEGASYWLGVDVHKKTYSIAISRVDGVAEVWSSPANPEVLIDQLRSLAVKIGGVAYEAGPTGFGLARALKAAGYDVIVAAPSRIPRPVIRGSKTDRLDCLKLAQYLQRGLLRSVFIPTADEESKRSLLRRRDQITDQIRRTKQRIKSFLLCHGLAEPVGLKNWSKASVRELHAMTLASGLRYTLDSLLYELDQQLSMKTVVKAQLADLVGKNQKDKEIISYHAHHSWRGRGRGHRISHGGIPAGAFPAGRGSGQLPGLGSGGAPERAGQTSRRAHPQRQNAATLAAGGGGVAMDRKGCLGQVHL